MTNMNILNLYGTRAYGIPLSIYYRGRNGRVKK